MTTPDDPLPPVERRLDAHLELLRQHPPHAPAMFVERVLRAARWQRAVRQPLLALAQTSAAILDGLRILLGGRR